MAQGSSNPTTNIKKIANNNVDTNTGNAADGTLRVVLATNQPVVPVSDNGGSITVDGTIASTQSGSWTVGLSAGTNNIGDVDVLTLPSIPAGTNVIGKTYLTDGTNDATVKAGSAAAVAADKALVVAVSPNNQVAVTQSGTWNVGLSAGTNNIGDVDVVSLPSLPAGTNNIGDVDVLSLPSLPAGTNNIGDVDVLSLPSLPAGTNNIGDVDVLTLPSIPAGTNVIGKTYLTDGTNDATVKAASTAAAATDKALVVAVSPNNEVTIKQATAANLNATVTGTVELGATSLAALENISVTVPGTVDLGTVSLTALETITVNQATPANLQVTATQAVGTAATRWYTQLSDGTNSPAIKAASSGAAAADPSLVVTISPNTPLPTGNNNIGDVDVASLPGTVAADITAIKTATELLDNTVVVHDSTAVTSVLQLGAIASSTAPTAVSANGDAVRLWATTAGALNVADGGSTISIDDGAGSITVDGTVAATQSGNWTVKPIVVNSLATALNALNVAVSLDVSETSGAGMVITATGTPSGIVLTPSLSFDGGTNWVNTYFDNPAGDIEATIPNASLSVGLSRTIVTTKGATHVRVQATSWTGGSVTVQLRGTQLQDPSVLFAATNNTTTRPPKTAQVGGWDGSNLRTLSTNTSGHVNIADGGNSITVDGTISVNALPAGTNNIGDVDIASIAAGTNVIGQVYLTDGTRSADVKAASTAAVASDKALVVAVSPNNTIGLSAGTNNIGDVDVLTLPSIPSGNNIIGKTYITDGNNDVTVKAASTAAVAADKALVVAISPNNTIGLSAGTNNIGDVDIVSLPSLPAGTNNIGDVDVASLPGTVATDITAIKTATELLDNTVVTHDATAVTSVLQLGALASSTAPTAVSANGDAVRLWATTAGALHIADGGGTISIDDGASSITVDGTVGLAAGTNNIGFVSLDGSLPAGSNFIGSVGLDTITPGTAAANLGKAVDGVAGSTDTGVLTLAVRDDALTTLTPVDGDYTQLRTTSTGRLWASTVIDTALPAGTNNIGDVDVISLPALSTGTNIIGKTYITDGTNDAAVKAASTAAVAADKALVVAISPNNTVGLGAGTNNIGDVDVLTLPSIPTGTNNIGTVEITSKATGPNTNATTTAYASSLVIKASAGTLYNITGYNSKTTAQFIQLFNSASLPADGTAPVVIFRVPETSNFSFNLGVYGRAFATGIVICNSSTGPTKTIGSADCWFDVQYR